MSHAILQWLSANRIDTAVTDPGEPWQNGTNESFNGKFRDECLSFEWFRSRSEASVIIEAWRRRCNAVRPHQSLNYLTPTEFKAAPSVQTCPSTPSHFPGINRSVFPPPV